MNIVINIDDFEYEEIKEDAEVYRNKGMIVPYLYKVIESGTPLPKGQRLIILSEDVVKREQTPLSFSCQNWISEVGLSNATVAIIKADKGKMNDADS